MKIWFAVCTALSGLFLAGLLSSMHSCQSGYEIDAAGRLSRSVTTDPSTNPPTVRHDVFAWESELPAYVFVGPRVAPGDRIVHTETTTRIPHLKLTMSKLEVLRRGEVRAVYREGHLLFWGLVVLISLVPLLVWSIAAVILLCLSPPKGRPSPE